MASGRVIDILQRIVQKRRHLTQCHCRQINGITPAPLAATGAANFKPKPLAQRRPLPVRIERFIAEKTGRKPAWLSHFARGLKIPRRKACRFDSGPGHHVNSGFAATNVVANNDDAPNFLATNLSRWRKSKKSGPLTSRWRAFLVTQLLPPQTALPPSQRAGSWAGTPRPRPGQCASGCCARSAARSAG